MILGSHNTITFKNPRCFLLRPFKWLYQCQEKNIDDMIKSNVRCFDFRFRFLFGKYYLCHGLAAIKCDIDEILTKINSLDIAYVRMAYENIFSSSDYETFLAFCHEKMKTYPNIKFQICKKKPTWTIIENYFDKKFIEIQTPITKSNAIKGPKYFAKNQEEKLKLYQDKDVIVSMDFV